MAKKLLAAWSIVQIFFLTGCSNHASENLVSEKSLTTLSISIRCSQDTPVTYMRIYQKAASAQPEVNSLECSDIRESLSGIRLNAVDINYVASFREWMVAVDLDKTDASRVSSLIARNLGKVMLVAVNKQVLSIALLSEPMTGYKIYIPVESNQAGEEMKKSLSL